MPKRSQRSTSQEFEVTLDELNGLSRRDFIRLNSALLITASLLGCEHPDDLSDTRKGFRVLRPDDLLSLRFDLHNLRIVHRYGKPSQLTRIDPDRDALLLIGFPGQHISEQTYKVTQAVLRPPVAVPATSLIAQPSRLVFRIPSDIDSVDLTLDALLDWQRFEPQLVSPAENRITPAPIQTRIEAPFGLVLSPGADARWTHATKPVTYAGRTELWHTRLLPGTPGEASEIRILHPGNEVDEAQTGKFDNSLPLADRRDLYGRTAHARTLILSPVGGWLDIRGEWQGDDSITRWEHQATAGQDQRVVVQRQDGFLYPFGHRATLMTVTEREVVAANWESGRSTERAAVLRKRDFVVIKEPEMTYSHASMAFESMRAQVLVTPALEVKDPRVPALWIEIAERRPHRFRFRARDWGEEELELDAPAVFVSASSDAEQQARNVAAAAALYADPDYDTHRPSAMRGQSAVVARYEDPENPERDRWGEPLKKERTTGDTTLKLIELRFAADDAEPAVDAPPFTCTTDAMQARVPSLEQFLNDDLNEGWFRRVDPEAPDNPGELFVVAMETGGRIPLYFDKQSERSGGLAAPSFDVDGLSRVLGPIGDRGSLTGELDWSKYLNADRANLLGGFNLVKMLAKTDGTKSMIVPRIDFSLTEKKVEKDDKKEDEEKKEEEKTKDDNDPAADKKDEDEAPATYKEAAVTLTWTVPMNVSLDLKIIALEPRKKDGKSEMNLEIAAGITKALGKPAETGKKDESEGEEKSSLGWSVKARVRKFNLKLMAGANPLLVVGFDYLGIALGPPEKPKKKEEEKKDEEAGSEASGEKDKKKSPSISRKIEHKISGIDASGALAYVQKILDAASHLPGVPDLPKLPGGSPAPSSTSDLSFPAKLPDIGSADINLTVGPMQAPDFDWMQFKVSNVGVAVSMGFYFFARPQKDGKEPEVPANEFAIRVAKVDNPLTLLAEPWGGFAHLGVNFTTSRITGFQAGLGVKYQFTLDLKITEAKCEGSLAGLFTYVDNGKDGTLDVDFVLKLSGRANLWIIDVYVLIIAAGKWTKDYFAFRAEVYINIKIAFFSQQLHVAFETRSGGSGGGGLLGAAMSGLPDAERITEEQWIAYRTAFAGAA